MEEKDFVPYSPSNDLKELGFDKPCFAKYFQQDGNTPFIQIGETEIEEAESSGGDVTFECDAPLYQQAFRWFREEYSLYSHVRESYAFDNTLEFVTQINGSYVNHGIEDKPINRFETYEEAELECLKKLIEIVKEN